MHYDSLNWIRISLNKAECENKSKPYQYILNREVKLLTSFTWPWGISENIFGVQSLADLAEGGA